MRVESIAECSAGHIFGSSFELPLKTGFTVFRDFEFKLIRKGTCWPRSMSQ